MSCAPSQTTSYWAPHAWTPKGILNKVRIAVQNHRFLRITDGVEPNDGDTVLYGMVMPGAANCHSHTFHRALRGLGDEGSTFWQWRNTMYRVAAQLTPEHYYRYARAIYTEMLLSGYTTVTEFHYVHHQPNGEPYSDPNAMGKALIQAAQDAGIRLTLLDTCYLHSDVKGTPLAAQQVRFGDGSAKAWRERVEALDSETDPTMTRIGAAVHSVRACSSEEASVVAQWAQNGTQDHPRPLHIHLSEQVAENEACLEHSGKTPTELLDSIGFWTPNTTAVHATHLTANDIEILGRSKASAAFCPTTEADLADGIGPAAELRDAGASLCIGSDENVSIDPFEELHRLDGHQRLASGVRDTFSTKELVQIMTHQGQKSAGWDQCGSIEAGYLADFIVVDTMSPRTAGASLDGIPLVATGADVTDVFVNGNRVVNQRQHKDGDPTQAIACITTLLRGKETL